MNQFLIPIIVAVVGSIFIMHDSRSTKKKKKRITTFNEHVQEIRDLINRCDNKAEWSLLDMEIDYLEQTWSGRVEDAVLIKETGVLYDKWHQRGDALEEIRTSGNFKTQPI